MSKKRVEKVRKSIRVRTTDRRSDANLSRGMYPPLERRKSRNGTVLFRLHDSERWSLDGDEEDNLPASHYERGYMV